MIVILYFCMFTLGTEDHLVCQAMPASSSMTYLNVGDYKGRTVAYPSIVEHKTNKGSLLPRHHVYAIDYYSSVDQGYSVFIRSPLIEHPPRGRTTNPQTSIGKVQLNKRHKKL
jgi:hypothetical protein